MSPGRARINRQRREDPPSPAPSRRTPLVLSFDVGPGPRRSAGDCQPHPMHGVGQAPASAVTHTEADPSGTLQHRFHDGQHWSPQHRWSIGQMGATIRHRGAMHWPRSQRDRALRHALPHLPQLKGSLAISTHAEPHEVHAPAVASCPVGAEASIAGEVSHGPYPPLAEGKGLVEVARPPHATRMIAAVKPKAGFEGATALSMPSGLQWCLDFFFDLAIFECPSRPMAISSLSPLILAM